MGGAGAAHQRSVDADHPGHAIRVQQRHHPHDQAAPVVAHEYGFVDLPNVQQSDQILAQFHDRVGGNLVRPIGQAVAALIDGDGLISGRGQWSKLVSPRVGQLWKAVAQYHWHAAPLLVHGHLDAVDLYELRCRQRIVDCGAERRRIAQRGRSHAAGHALHPRSATHGEFPARSRGFHASSRKWQADQCVSSVG